MSEALERCEVENTSLRQDLAAVRAERDELREIVRFVVHNHLIGARVSTNNNAATCPCPICVRARKALGEVA